jgi:mannose-1-phosphate guanylyltransferase
MPAKPDIRAVIMAGGSGTRFWPLSRRKTPKQFLPIVSSRTMLEETARRILPLVPLRRIYTIADAAQTRTIRRLLPRLPAGNYLVEPEARNTAPSLILATARIFLENPKAVVAVLPSDHLITEESVFRKKVAAAAAAAAAEDALITFGIPPTFPSTGYGYIHYRKGGARKFLGEPFREVVEFKEKPSTEKAVAFLREGGYAWNSGMFFWRADVFAGKLERFAPEFYAAWTRMLAALTSDLRTNQSVALRSDMRTDQSVALSSGSRSRVASVFSGIPAISIDYALMEKARGVLMAEGNFGWSDVGAWSSLADIWARDHAGNAVKGAFAALDARNNVVCNPGRLTALIGVEDLVIVNTKDALLVCRRERDQNVKQILELLARTGKTDYL